MTDAQNLDTIQKFHEQLKERLHQCIIGYDDLMDLLTIAFLSDGALLMEGVPGTAKTTLCKFFAQNIGGKFGRLQGAVDILPMDVIGFQKHDPVKNTFIFSQGPIFSNLFLVDEINRMTPKAQGALLEALAERQVTIDNKTEQLPKPFLVIATQNPYEMEGTFNLIESQKDRFTLSYRIEHLDVEDEVSVLRKGMTRGLDPESYRSDGLLVSTGEILKMQEAIKTVYASDDILSYIGDLIEATRHHDDIKLGVSTRGSLALLRSAMAHAALQGRGYVIPDDVKYLVPFAFYHRIILKRESALTGRKVEQIIKEILETVPVR
ncbi:MAG TPA: MoxR family ATPase [Methanocorpusculum sp.]|nr:MoxR family ATPase [Methanocorpusculum sp.]HJJ52917.1 MoxR family ATPase [Methanocorpusculum sp.]